MDALMKLSREVQVVLGGTALYLIFSFFDWQQVSYLGITAGRSEWSGVGVVAALIAIALLAWETYRVVAADVELGSVEPGQVSAGLALALLVFTVITFVSHNEARHWPAWIGLLLSIVITVFALKRSHADGVSVPNIRALGARGGSGSTSGSAAEPPTQPPAPPATAGEPPPATDPSASV